MDTVKQGAKLNIAKTIAFLCKICYYNKRGTHQVGNKVSPMFFSRLEYLFMDMFMFMNDLANTTITVESYQWNSAMREWFRANIVCLVIVVITVLFVDFDDMEVNLLVVALTMAAFFVTLFGFLATDNSLVKAYNQRIETALQQQVGFEDVELGGHEKGRREFLATLDGKPGFGYIQCSDTNPNTKVETCAVRFALYSN